jgi:hypothetical protein
MCPSWRSMGASVFALAVAIVACSSSSSQGLAVSDGCAAGAAIPCTCPNGTTAMATCSGGAYGTCQCGGVTPPTDSGPGTPEASTTPDATVPTDSSTMDSPHGEGGETGSNDLDAPDDAAFGTYMGPCSVDGDCPMGDLCHNFPSKGLHCTKTCELASDCPAPSPGCTPNGVCAIP